jgi:hypothetical protein
LAVPSPRCSAQPSTIRSGPGGNSHETLPTSQRPRNAGAAGESREPGIRLSNARFVAARAARARLVGKVNLKPADPDEDRYWATLTALEGSQSRIEEHFTEEDLTDVSDAIAFATGRETFDLLFNLEDFSDIFLGPLRAALEQAGVTIDAPLRPTIEEHSSNENT